MNGNSITNKGNIVYVYNVSMNRLVTYTQAARETWEMHVSSLDGSYVCPICGATSQRKCGHKVDSLPPHVSTRELMYVLHHIPEGCKVIATDISNLKKVACI